jgi:hypothetical protein
MFDCVIRLSFIYDVKLLKILSFIWTFNEIESLYF